MHFFYKNVCKLIFFLLLGVATQSSAAHIAAVEDTGHYAHDVKEFANRPGTARDRILEMALDPLVRRFPPVVGQGGPVQVLDTGNYLTVADTAVSVATAGIVAATAAVDPRVERVGCHGAVALRFIEAPAVAPARAAVVATDLDCATRRRLQCGATKKKKGEFCH
jgi:hypothetical protein